MHTRFLLTSTLLFVACSSDVADYAGRFEGDGLTVELRADGARFAGSLALGGATYAATAAPTGERLAGEFRVGDANFSFTMSPSADGMRLMTGGTTYELRRVVAPNPLARSEPGNPLGAEPARTGGGPTAPATAVAPAAGGAAVPAPHEGRQVSPEVAREMDLRSAEQAKALAEAPAFTSTYRHPAGVYFLHPEGWKVEAVGEGAVALLAPDPAMVGGERAELLLVVGEDAGGVASVSDPRALALVDEFVSASFPYLTRDGRPEPSRLGPHTALTVRWKGSVSGTDMRAAMHVTLLGGYALGAFALAPKEHHEARARTMADVVRTFGYDRPKGDPRLVGSWRYTKTYTSGTFSSVTERYLTLAADGTCTESGKMMAGMEHTDSTGQVTGSSSADVDGEGQRGRWRVEGQEVVVEWGDRVGERWRFHVDGGSMLWQRGGERRLWQRTR